MLSSMGLADIFILGDIVNRDPIVIYGDSISGNCLKVRYVATKLGIPFDWIETEVLNKETRTPAFLAMNPAGQVPVVKLADGRFLAQSNAIMLSLAEGSDLIPAESYDRALMMQWMFWEQYSHETAIAVLRFQKSLLGKTDAEIDPALRPRGVAALSLMDHHLAQRIYFVGDGVTLADIALIAYTRLAHEADFDLSGWPNVLRWVRRIERELNLAPAN